MELPVPGLPTRTNQYTRGRQGRRGPAPRGVRPQQRGCAAVVAGGNMATSCMMSLRHVGPVGGIGQVWHRPPVSCLMTRGCVPFAAFFHRFGTQLALLGWQVMTLPYHVPLFSGR